jgi:hypothetical protein
MCLIQCENIKRQASSLKTADFTISTLSVQCTFAKKIEQCKKYIKILQKL